MKTLGVVLAGGTSVRFGADKASAALDGKTLLQHVCERAAPQVDLLVVNRSEGRPIPDGYARLPDEWPDEGPLAGILAALAFARDRSFAYVASFPCDAPFFPIDLTGRLRDQLVSTDADICFARSAGREHRTFALWNVACEPSLRAAFVAGLHSLYGTSDVLIKTAVDFPSAGRGRVVDCFLNINTPDDLALAASWLVR